MKRTNSYKAGTLVVVHTGLGSYVYILIDDSRPYRPYATAVPATKHGYHYARAINPMNGCTEELLFRGVDVLRQFNSENAEDR